MHDCESCVDVLMQISSPEKVCCPRYRKVSGNICDLRAQFCFKCSDRDRDFELKQSNTGLMYFSILILNSLHQISHTHSAKFCYVLE